MKKIYILKSSLSFRKILLSLTLISLFLWTIAQPLTLLGSIDFMFRSLLYKWKNILGVVFLFFSGVTLIEISFARVLSGVKFPILNVDIFRRQRDLIAIYAIFIIYIIANISLIYKEINIYLIGMYIVWGCIFLVVVPRLLHNKFLWKQSLEWIFRANILIVLIGIVTGIKNGHLFWMGTSRLTFDFLNPNYYAMSLQVIFVWSMYKLLSEKKYRTLHFIITFGSLLLIWEAHSRNVFLFCVVLIIILFIGYLSKLRRVLLIILLLFIFFVTMAIYSYNISIEQLDDFTSRRVTLWRSLLSNTFADKVSEVIFGVGDKISSGNFSIPSLDPASTSRFYSRHVDSAYLDLLLKHGLIGLLLFFTFMYYILHLCIHRIKKGGDIESWIATGSLIGLLFQMTFISGIPSLGNPVNIFFFIYIIPIAIGFDDE